MMNNDLLVLARNLSWVIIKLKSTALSPDRSVANNLLFIVTAEGSIEGRVIGKFMF